MCLETIRVFKKHKSVFLKSDFFVIIIMYAPTMPVTNLPIVLRALRQLMI